MEQMSVNILKINSVEQHMNFFQNFLWRGYRWRVYSTRWYFRNPCETFAEFLEYFVRDAFGEKWWLSQTLLERDCQHVVYRWAYDCNEVKKTGCIDQRTEEDGSISFIPSGPVLSWLAFAYDLLCLFHMKVLPKKLLNRLRNHEEFQGAWFEVAVAATILRAGCEIRWINDSTKRNCELIATHRSTRIQFGVEAKSKRRPKVLNHNGIHDSPLGPCAGLVHNALGQAPSDIPFVLFIDLNLPFTPHSEPVKKPIMQEVKRIIESLDQSSVEIPDKFSVLIATSFSFHYGDINTPAPPHDHCDVLPCHTKHPLCERIVNDITLSINRYGLIPEDV